MTALLSGIVLILFICHTPKIFINLYESYQVILYGELKMEPLWGRILIKFNHFLLTLSSALNIVIYSYNDFKFRAVLGIFCKRYRYLCIAGHPHNEQCQGGQSYNGLIDNTTMIT